MIRHPDWRARLDRVIAAGRTAPFVYGEHDCMRFPAACIEAVTGTDLFQPFVGKYRDAGGAAALVPSIPALLEHLAARHGWVELPAAQVGRGGLALLGLGRTKLCALVYDGLLVPESPAGLRRFSLRGAIKGWRLG